jgi:hypothetical protein
VEDYLAGLDGTIHNPVVTRILSAASMWAYSDLKTFASMMCHRGLYGEFVGITVTNSSALVDTTAYLFLSDTQKLGILTFRGTAMNNLANWLSNANTHMTPQGEGAIHSGFLNASIVVLPILQSLLLTKDNLARGLLKIRDTWGIPEQVFPENLEEAACDVADYKRCREELEERRRKAQGEAAEDPCADAKTPSGPALFFCGHSLGGAYAAMAGAMMQLEPSLKDIRENLRSVYTFGQPMFADKTFAEALEPNLGKRVFRHQHKRDIVPRLPGHDMGKFYHFGQNYVDSDDVWVRESTVREWWSGRRSGPVRWTLLSNVIGVLASASASFPVLRSLLTELPSWADHSPLHYVRISQASRSGWDILGPELAGDVPGSSSPGG